MYMAIATEAPKHPRNRADYKVWYLELNQLGKVVSIGVMSRKELVENLFINFRKNGESNWKAFCKNDEQSKTIEIYDFIAQNIEENTHFGDLPTVDEFQSTLDYLQSNLEIRPLAS